MSFRKKVIVVFGKHLLWQALGVIGGFALLLSFAFPEPMPSVLLGLLVCWIVFAMMFRLWTVLRSPEKAVSWEEKQNG